MNFGSTVSFHVVKHNPPLNYWIAEKGYPIVATHFAWDLYLRLLALSFVNGTTYSYTSLTIHNSFLFQLLSRWHARSLVFCGTGSHSWFISCISQNISSGWSVSNGEVTHSTTLLCRFLYVYYPIVFHSEAALTRSHIYTKPVEMPKAKF